MVGVADKFPAIYVILSSKKTKKEDKIMQLFLPIFPKEATFINSCIGVYEKDEMVTYILNGLPVYTHHRESLQSFKYITSNFIKQGLCKQCEIVKTFHVSPDFVRRNYKRFNKEGEAAFFSKDKRHGYSYKLTPEVITRIQGYLDGGMSNTKAAKKEGISEGAIRYAIKEG